MKEVNLLHIWCENDMCDYPGCENIPNLPFMCKFCGQSFCVEHRLPEKHECVRLPKVKSMADFLESSKIKNDSNKRLYRINSGKKHQKVKKHGIIAKVAIILGILLIFGIFDWNYLILGPYNEYEQTEEVNFSRMTLYEFKLTSFRERIKISVVSDDLFSIYLLNQENFELMEYNLNNGHGPDYEPLDYLKYVSSGKIQATQINVNCDTEDATQFYLVFVGSNNVQISLTAEFYTKNVVVSNPLVFFADTSDYSYYLL